ncbi:TPA: hypothetical protein EYP66_00510 [Candidatus Poribacteria bacterium]|nr:hypothetical protein [Candidatus Poribacteria bacterium]
MTITQKIASIIITALILIFISSTSTLPQSEKWQILETEHFIIHYTNEHKQAVSLQRVSENFYKRATDMLGTIAGKIDIWLISGRDFRATAPIQDWAVGYAYPLKRRIVIKNPSFLENSKLELARVVKHEIVHVIFGARIGKYMKNVPLWFNEGIAMYGSEEWSYGHYWLMLTYVFSKSIIPLNKLSNQFPKEKRLAQLAYAESFSAVSMIARDYGDEKLREITDLLAIGEDMDSALLFATGMNLAQFQQRWMQYLTKHYKWFSILSSSMILWGAVSLIVVWAYLRQRRLRRMKIAEWEEEESQQDEFFTE